jgi:glutamyl endopeptidase
MKVLHLLAGGVAVILFAIATSVSLAPSVSAAVTDPYSDAVSLDNPAAFWRLGDAVGAPSAADASGHGYLLTAAGITFGASGALDGIPDTAATVPTGATLSASTWPTFAAVEFWVQTTQAPSQAVDLMNITSTINGRAEIPWSLSLAPDGTLSAYELDFENALQYTIPGPSGSIADGYWHHIVVNFTNSTATMYVDGRAGGTAVSSTYYTGTYCDICPEPALTFGGGGFAGAFDEIALYGTALSQTQIDAHIAPIDNATIDDQGNVYNFTNTLVGDELTADDGSIYVQDVAGTGTMESTGCCGPDTSHQVTDTTIFPYRAVAFISYRDSGTEVGTCSGFMIGVSTVGTAGHCVFGADFGGDGWARHQHQIVVLPGYNFDAFNRAPFGQCSVTRTFVTKGWMRTHNENLDYGAMKLDCSVGTQTGYFGFTSVASPIGVTSILAGYPSASHTVGTMWRSTDHVHAATNTRLFYGNDVAPGSSGSPVYRGANSGCRWCVFGIETTQRDVINGENLNGGTRMTNMVRANLNHWKHL